MKISPRTVYNAIVYKRAIEESEHLLKKTIRNSNSFSYSFNGFTLRQI